MSADARTIEVEQLEIMTTRDGSQTLRDPASGITYRSAYGARTEARHVFVDGTRVLEEAGPRHILEIGLGGGTNLIETLTQRAARGIENALTYHAVERAPIPAELAQSIHKTPDSHGNPGLTLLVELLTQFHANPAPRIERRDKATGVTVVLHACEWTEAELDQSFDAVYHDPFAAGTVRRNLAAAGLTTAWREGAGGKREMTVAAKSRDALTGYQLCSASKQPAGFVR